MTRTFLDTNVLLRYLTRDDEEKAQAALALLTRLERGEEKMATSPMVIFETVFTLQNSYQVPRKKIRDLLMPIISLRGLKLERRGLYRRAFDLYCSKSISFADAYNIAFMEDQKITEVYSYDADFDQVEGLKRLEPQPPNNYS